LNICARARTKVSFAADALTRGQAPHEARSLPYTARIPAKKNRLPSEPPKAPTDIVEAVKLHIATTRRLRELAEEVETLRRAGEIREARQVYKRMEVIADQLRQLEDAVRPFHGP
jgi:hypothetical protein